MTEEKSPSTERERIRAIRREAVELDRFQASLDDVKFVAKPEKPKGK